MAATGPCALHDQHKVRVAREQREHDLEMAGGQRRNSPTSEAAQSDHRQRRSKRKRAVVAAGVGEGACARHLA